MDGKNAHGVFTYRRSDASLTLPWSRALIFAAGALVFFLGALAFAQAQGGTPATDANVFVRPSVAPSEVIVQSAPEPFAEPVSSISPEMLRRIQSLAQLQLAGEPVEESPLALALNNATVIDPPAPSQPFEPAEPQGPEVTADEVIGPQPTVFDFTPLDAPSTERVAAIEGLLNEFGSPALAGTADTMIIAAQTHGIDWRLIPVISMVESTGGKAICGFNAWGFDNCTGEQFGSFEAGIWRVAETLGGQNAAYIGASLEDKLCIWVSGRYCAGNAQGITYLSKASYWFGMLGGFLTVPPLPANAAPEEPAPGNHGTSPNGVAPPAASTTPAEGESTPTPSASTTPEPGASSTPEADGSPTAPSGTPTKIPPLP